LTYINARQRPEIQLDDVKDPQRLVRKLNDAFRSLGVRLEAVEDAGSTTTLEDLSFNTGPSVSPTVAPFANGRLRVACPFSPTGVVLLDLQQVAPPGQPVSTSANQVKWSFASGGDAGAGAIIVEFVTGLAANTAYKLRLGVTRG
jgi:hypothetical protein